MLPAANVKPTVIMTVARHLASAASAVEAALEAAVVAIHGEQNDRQESDLENDWDVACT